MTARVPKVNTGSNINIVKLAIFNRKVDVTNFI